MTFQRLLFSTSRRSRGLYFHCHNVGIQRCDVPESYLNLSFQRRDVATQRGDVATQRCNVTKKKTQLFEKQISKVKSTPIFRFHSLSNPGFDYPSYLSAASLISEPENIMTHISYSFRENLHL